MRWPLVLAGCGALFLMVGVSTVRETYREWKVDQEIRGLQSQVESLEGKKSRLTDLVQRLNAGDGIDKEARTRLGLRKPGERVIILRGLEPGEASWQESFSTPIAAAPATARSNPGKWFSYFFRIRETL